MASNDRGKRPAWTPPWRGRRVRTFACERKFRSGRVGQRIRADNSCMSAVSVCNVAYSPPQGAQYHPQHVSDIDKGIVVPLWNGPMAMLQTTVLPAPYMMLRTIYQDLQDLNWLEDICGRKIANNILELAPLIVGRPSPGTHPPSRLFS